MSMFQTIIEEGRHGKLNEYLLFYKKLEQQNKILTSTYETNHKEFEGFSQMKVSFPNCEKMLVKFNENCKLRAGAGILISSDKDGENPKGIVFEN